MSRSPPEAATNSWCVATQGRWSGRNRVDELGELAGDGLLARRAGDLHAFGAGADDDGVGTRDQRGAGEERDGVVVDLHLLTDAADDDRAGLHLGERHR